MANLARIEDIIEVVGMTNYIKSLELPEHQLKYTGYIIDDANQAVLNFKYIYSQEQVYLQKVAISKNRKLTFIQCSCHDFNEQEYCPHIALVIKFLFEQKEMINEIVDSLKTEQDNTFNQYLFSQFIKEKNQKQPITLEIILKKEYYYHQENGTYLLQLKIGQEKLYQLNSQLRYFLQNYHDPEFEWEFGKYFTYQSKIHYFKENDEKILSFLSAYYSTKNPYESYYDNKILLSESLVKQFFPLLKQHDFYIQTGLLTEHYSKIRTDFKLESELKEENEEIELVLPNLNIEALTSDYTYIKYQNHIYALEEESAKLLSILVTNKRKNIVFKKEEYEQFGKLILPVIKKMDQGVKIDHKIKEQFLDTPLIPKFYINAKDQAICAKIMLTYQDKEINLLEKNNKIGDHFIVRNSSLEQTYIDALIDYGFTCNQKEQEFVLTEVDHIATFLEYGLDALCHKYQVFVSKEVKNKRIMKTVYVKSSFEIGKDNILSYQFDCNQVPKEELYQLLVSIKENKKYYQLKNGDILSLRDSDLETFTYLVDSFDLTEEELKKGNVFIEPYQLAKVEDVLEQEYVTYGMDVQTLLNRFHNYKNQKIIWDEESEKILREYQKDGVKFFVMLAECGFGGILADEMGLGKSLQTITYMKLQLQKNRDAKFLIVVPTSLIYNWENEIKKFAPELSYLIVNDKKNERVERLHKLDNVQIIITTYGLLRQDIELYENLSFHTCIIDEAQAIKNLTSQNAKAVKKIVATTKFALTGTPIENSILELWSIFDFVMPGFLKNSKQFKELYSVKKIEEHPERLDELKKQISPFILRRKKSDVLKDLPEKIENTVYIDLTEEQKKLYLAWLETTKEEIEKVVKDGNFEKSQILILSLLMKLRQICIEPRLIMENYKGESAKLVTLLDMLKQIIENGHKVLLFSQFPSALQFIKEAFDEEKITYYYLDGSTKSKTRMELVDKFNQDETNVFLISLKAGGTGLNLTSADVVIHFDPWWNPQVENQATDRTHRIGQKNVVEVLKFITKGTIEEKILELQEKKKRLSEQVIEGKERSELVLSKLDEEELRELLELS